MRSAAASSLRRLLGCTQSASSWREQPQHLSGEAGNARRAKGISIVRQQQRRRQTPPLSPPRPPPRLSFFSSCSATRYPLAHLTQEAREEVYRVIELAERASARWTIDRSCFLPPPTVAAALAALAPRGDVAGVAWGGFPGAERARVIVGRPEDLGKVMAMSSDNDGPEEVDEEEGEEGEFDVEKEEARRRRNPKKSRSPPLLDLSDPDVGGVSAVSISGNFAFDQASHRDFLGAILGSAGIDRRVCGDVVVRGERGATALVASPVAEALTLSLTRIRSVPVEASVIPLGELDFPVAAKAGENALAVGVPVRSVEASLRLDAVASARFRAPRSGAASAARAGELKLNYGEAKPSVSVASGDLISWRGKGRVKVVGVEMTKRGKFAVEMERFTS